MDRWFIPAEGVIRMKRLIVFLLCFTFLVNVPVYSLASEEKKEEPSASVIFLDVMLVRPLGIVSIALGTGVFIISLPFTIPTRTVGLAGKKLVKEPFLYTFARPVGDLNE